MKASEIRQLTDKEIIEKIQEEEVNLVRNKINHAISPIENPQRIKISRRLIARLKSILRERQLKEQNK